MKRRKCNKINFYYFLIYLNVFINNFDAAPSPARSCRDHYLSGFSKSTVLPLSETLITNSQVFRVECIFPDYSWQSDAAIVTSIHNGLEQWQSLNLTDKRTIGYQISDWSFLRTIVAKSLDCVQDIYIKWYTTQPYKVNSTEILPKFSIESLHGRTLHFEWNDSSLEKNVYYRLEGEDAGILHIIPFISSTNVSIRASSLMCRQLAINNNQCLFDLKTITEMLLINLEFESINLQTGTIGFSFRTDRPTQPFFSIRTHSGNFIRVDLIDGYLITVNHIIHPVGFLADGNWHRAVIDLKTLVLKIDSDENASGISLRSLTQNLAGSENVEIEKPMKILELTILLTNSQITAIQLSTLKKDNTLINTKFENVDENNWLCSNSKLIQLRNDQNKFQQRLRYQTDNQFIFSKQICPIFSNKSNNFCNCFGPKSAISIDHHPANCPIIENSAFNAVRLRRASDRLSFIYVPNFYPKSSISVVFRSDSDNGLILFGTWTFISHQSSLIKPIAPSEQSSRVQIHFVGQTMSAILCTRLTDNSERCYSCSIIKPEGYSNSKWLRVSLFFHEVYYFMTLNERICHLSPNSVEPGVSDLYKVSNTVQNILLVGGMYYTKQSMLHRHINDTIRREFYDNTREKPLSFQGCIGEVRVSGNIQNLTRLLYEQKIIFMKQTSDLDLIFSIEEFGCRSICTLDCGNAPCKLKNTLDKITDKFYEDKINDYTCDCASTYAIQNPNNSQLCIPEKTIDFSIDKLNKWEELLLTSTKPVKITVAESLRLTDDEGNNNRILTDHLIHRVLNKLWFLLKFPTSNEELHTIFDLGPIEIQVGQNGKHIVISIEEYFVKEDFYLSENVNDKRLHLLAIELNPAIGTSINEKSLIIRLDNEIRTVYGISEIPFHPISDQWQIIPVTNNDELGIDESGCLARFVLNFAMPDEDHSIRHFPQRLNNSNMQLNYLEHIVERISRQNSDDPITKRQENLLLKKADCGFYDTTLWLRNSSSWGTIGEYDPDRRNLRESIISFISLILTLTLIIVLIIIICCYSYYRFRCERKQLYYRGQQYKRNIAKKSTLIDGAFDKFSINSADEKKLLKSDSLNLDSAKNSYITTRSPSQNLDTINTSIKVSPDELIEFDSSHLITATSKRNGSILNENFKLPYSDQLIIDDYSSSPKLTARRNLSKSGTLLRRPPDPPMRPLQIHSNNQINNFLGTMSSLNTTSPSLRSSESTAAPIVRHEEL